MYFDKRIIYLILGCLILVNVISLLSEPETLLTLLLTIPAVLIAITFHEYAHAFAADKLGDDTPRRQGRLTLNPLKHLDPFGTLMLFFAGFGWGKPVEIDSRNFNRNIKMSAAEAIVAAAGPIMNFVLAIVFSFIYAILWKFAYGFIVTQIGYIMHIVVKECIVINLGLGIFNLIPLPPLDGSNIIKGILPYKVRNWFEQYYQIFYFVFIVIWITKLASLIISPVINAVSEWLMNITLSIFGLI